MRRGGEAERRRGGEEVRRGGEEERRHLCGEERVGRRYVEKSNLELEGQRNKIRGEEEFKRRREEARRGVKEERRRGGKLDRRTAGEEERWRGGEKERRRRYGECLGELERMRIGECKILGGEKRSIRESKEEIENGGEGEVGRKGWENQRSK